MHWNFSRAHARQTRSEAGNGCNSRGPQHWNRLRWPHRGSRAERPTARVGTRTDCPHPWAHGKSAAQRLSALPSSMARTTAGWVGIKHTGGSGSLLSVLKPLLRDGQLQVQLVHDGRVGVGQDLLPTSSSSRGNGAREAAITCTTQRGGEERSFVRGTGICRGRQAATGPRKGQARCAGPSRLPLAPGCTCGAVRPTCSCAPPLLGARRCRCRRWWDPPGRRSRGAPSLLPPPAGSGSREWELAGRSGKPRISG